MRVFRLTGGATREKIISISAQATASSSTQVFVATASANIVGSLANKSASLARTDGGVFNAQSKDDTLVADTLLSWDDVGPGPGATYKTLTGAYGGTWSKKPNGTNDVYVTWSGATPQEGMPSVGGNPTPDNLSPSTYPFTTTDGKMPMADLSSASPKTQDWKYSVHDRGDGTDLALTCHWIAHFAYENFQEASASLRSGPSGGEYTIDLTNSNPSGSAQINAGSISWSTNFAVNSGGLIPGFVATSKHVGIPAFQARAGQTTAYPWASGTSAQTWDEIWGDGAYGIRKRLKYKAHVGIVKAWNAKGKSEDQTLEYDLDNECVVVEEAIFPIRRL